MFSCKSSSNVEKDVHPLNLLDDGAAFYIKLPTKVDPVLLKRIIQSNVDGLSESDASMIVSRIECTYAGISRTRNETAMQTSVLANIPQKIISSALKKNTGWKSAKFNAPFNSYEYFSSPSSEMQLSVLSKKNAVVAKDVSPMITHFDNLSYGKDENIKLNEDVYNFLHEDADEIRFYAPNPLSFLTILTGANLNFRLSYVKGSMVTDKKSNDQYIMSIEFEFGQERFVRVGKSMIGLAFGLTDSQMEQTTPTHVSMKGIKIDKKQLYKLFLL